MACSTNGLQCFADRITHAMQVGSRPTEAQKRTLELEAPAEALGPAEKKRIIDSVTSSTAVDSSLKQGLPSASHAAQNGSAAQHAPSASSAGEPKMEGAGQRQEQEKSAAAAPGFSAGVPQAEVKASAGPNAGSTEGDVGMSDAGAKAGSGAKSNGAQAQEQQSRGTANGMPAKQEQLPPSKQQAERSREVTPELCLDHLDAKTGQVCSSLEGAPQGWKECLITGFILRNVMKH